MRVTDDDLKSMSDREILVLLNSDDPINLARKAFANWSGQIEQAHMQRKPPTPIETRRMEFMAALAISTALRGQS